MLLDQDVIDPQVQMAICMAGRIGTPKTLAELLSKIESYGKATAPNPDAAVFSLMHLQAEQLWYWADPEEWPPS